MATSGASPPLGSDWGGLSDQLKATFFAVQKVKSGAKIATRWERDMTQPEVCAPLTDGHMETTLNWQSPFENVGPDQKFSSLSAMLQSGGFDSILASLQARFPNIGALDSAKRLSESAEGRSNMTKLNSTQVFSGMAPIKISVTAHFRAFQNADLEVRQPVNQLMEWALPKKIAQNGIASMIVAGESPALQSLVPQIIGMKFADMLFAPIVIESIPYPLTGPRDRNGVMTHASLAMTLGTLTALDKHDWQEARSSTNFASYNYK